MPWLDVRAPSLLVRFAVDAGGKTAHDGAVGANSTKRCPSLETASCHSRPVQNREAATSKQDGGGIFSGVHQSSQE
eukprot:1670897-Pyramimonas_sp.AAC.2